MTRDELRQAYRRLMRVIENERAMRYRVFPSTHERHKEKTEEINQAVNDLQALGHALRDVLDEPRQGTLIDVPEPKRRGAY